MLGSTAAARAALPPALGEALAGYEEHLAAQRDLSQHTIPVSTMISCCHGEFVPREARPEVQLR